jgi:ADP-heptose:LPS heptosyltransferase
VVFLGGPGDPTPKTGESLVGKLTLRESMAVIASSELHVSADTGNGHIAAAYGVPTVSVFGPMDPVRFRPYGPKATVLRDPSHRPEAITADQILEACLAKLGERVA